MNFMFQVAHSENMAKKRIYALTLVMLIIFVASRYGAAALTAEEGRAMEKVSAMQASLWEWLNSSLVRERAAEWAERSGWEDIPPLQVDHRKSGLIGVEWSEITTTLGVLALKQETTDPLWAAHILRWLDKAGLTRGDRVMILASASFPGFLVSALAAAETRGLQIDLVVSLGSSTWGANRMEAPWPLLELRLRQAGHLQTRSRYYTPGGREETGANYSVDATDLLEEASAIAEAPFLKPVGLNEVVLMKTEELLAFRPKLLILIGGSASATGGSDDILPPGLTLPGTSAPMGRGVAAAAVENDIPVLHLLNVRALSQQAQINMNPLYSIRTIWQAAGLTCFLAALVTHRRWAWQ